MRTRSALVAWSVVAVLAFGAAAVLSTIMAIDLSDAYRYEHNPQARAGQVLVVVIAAVLAIIAVVMAVRGPVLLRNRRIAIALPILFLGAFVAAVSSWAQNCFFKC